MDEFRGLQNSKYAYLRKLPVEKLLELLEIAPVPASCPEDEAYADALEEAIIEKETEHPTGILPDVGEAVLEPGRMEHTVSTQNRQQPLEVSPKRVIRLRQVRRTILVSAAAIVCALAVMVTAQAAGVDVFGAMARWSEDVFSFGQITPDSEVSDNPGQGADELETDDSAKDQEFASLQEAFDAYGITEVHEPSWLPEGYVLCDIDVLAIDDPFLRTFNATYTNGEGLIGIGIMSYEDEPSTQVQKIGIPVESMVKDGVITFEEKARKMDAGVVKWRVWNTST